MKNQALAATVSGIDAIFAKDKLDAIVYPTSPRPATLIVPDKPPMPGAGDGFTHEPSRMKPAIPDLIVPAGMTPEGLPVTISFFGPAWSEPKLLGYGYDFEQATKAIRQPKNTPALPTDKL